MDLRKIVAELNCMTSDAKAKHNTQTKQFLIFFFSSNSQLQYLPEMNNEKEFYLNAKTEKCPRKKQILTEELRIEFPWMMISENVAESLKSRFSAD